jgi:hypothetical protein
MPIVQFGDEYIQFPDSMSDQEIEAVLKQQYEEQRQRLEAKADVPVILPSGQVQQTQQPTPEPRYSLGEYARAAPEVAASLLTGATTGLMGQGVGFVQQAAREFQQPGEGLFGTQYGTTAAARRIQEAAMAQGQRATITPESPAGMQLLSGVGEALSPLQALDPVMTGPLIQQVQGTLATRAAREAIRKEAQLAPMQEGVEAMLQRKVPVMGRDIAPPKTAVQQMGQAIGERLPFVGTGGSRRSQQEARIDATRGILEDAGAIEFQGASNKVMKDLLSTRAGLINRYTKEKKEVIDSLSRPIFVKKPGQPEKFVESTQPVQMAKLNEYIDNQLTEQGYLRMAQQGDPDAIAIVNELEGIRRNFSGNTRLSDIEFKRRMLGESYKATDPGSIKAKAKTIIDNAYGPIVEDMGNFIEAYGGKEDKLKWRRANRNLKDNIDDLKDRAFASMLRNGEADPDIITRNLLSNRPAKIRTIYKNLSPEGRKNADRLFLNQAYQFAVRREAGGEYVDPDQFTKFINKHPAVMKNMDPDRRNEIQGFVRGLELTTGAKRAETLPPTGVVNQVPILGALSAVIFGSWGPAVAATGVGLASRYIESPTRVRKAFQNLGMAPKGSRAERVAFNALQKAIVVETTQRQQQAQREAEMQRALQAQPQ